MLRPTKIKGRVEALLINTDRGKTLASERVERIAVTFAGFAGEAHGGLTRTSCSRVMAQYPKGTEIRNVRQITIVSREELEQIARNMKVDEVRPEWIGANLMLSGIPDLSLVPPCSRLIFSAGPSLVVDMENGPCKYPGEVIDRVYPGLGRQFPKAARHLRGVTAWVEREGEVSVDAEVVLHVPVQPPYTHVDAGESVAS